MMLPGRCVRPRGLSLIETIFGVFLISIAILMVVVFFHSSLRYQRSLEIRGKALLLANAKMAEIRAWAKNPVNFASNWATYQGATSSDPSAPEITMTSQCDPSGRRLQSPCQTLEAAHGADAREMLRAVIPVRVVAQWGVSPGSQLSLISYVGQPVPATAVRQAAVLTLVPVASPLAASASTPFSVTGVDGNGLPLNDLFYHWVVASRGGNGRIQPGSARHGRSGQLENLYEYSTLVPPQPVPGEVVLECSTRYHGTPLRAVSAPVTMQ